MRGSFVFGWARGLGGVAFVLGRGVLVGGVLGVFGLCGGVVSAGAAAPRWSVTSVSAATNFVAGDARGYDAYVLTVTNTGDAAADGSVSPVVVSDVLPVGVTSDVGNVSPATEESGVRGFANFGSFLPFQFLVCSAVPLQCTFEAPAESVPPGRSLTITIPVDIAPNAPAGAVNTATVSGGGAPSVSVSEQKTFAATPASFGFSGGAVGFDGEWLTQDGSPDTQAGSHPFSMTTRFAFNTLEDPTTTGAMIPAGGQVRNIRVDLPPGLVGNPTAVPTCSMQDFYTPGSGGNENACPDNTALGFVVLGYKGEQGNGTENLPVYNLQPPGGTPALFGFSFSSLRATISLSVRTGTDYGATATLREVSQAVAITSSTLTLWGVPSDPSHDSVRGHCLSSTFRGLSLGSCSAGLPAKPFLTMPGACAGPQTTRITADSWSNPGVEVSDSFVSHDLSGNPIGVARCDRLDFSATVTVHPDTSVASSPTGLSVQINIPQNDNPVGLSEANMKKAVVRLPAGMSVNPSSADGLAACTLGEIGFERLDPATQADFFTPTAASCPDASKIGAVEIITPLLKDPVKGSIYLAEQNNNPFQSLLALYIVAEGDGVLIKLAGHVEADPATGQLTTTFDNSPQQPFSELKVTLFGGPRAPLVTPPSCGEFHTESSLTPWSDPTPVTSTSLFNITSGCAGGFNPSFTAGTASSQASGFSSFSTVIGRSDADQTLGRISVRTPPGLFGLLSKIPLCGEPQAAQGTCPAASKIGHTTTSVGVGIDPLTLPQAGKPQDPVFLTGPYNGAPFGLSIVVPAEAGPFNLGTVIVRATINVDRDTGRLTITSDPLPTILQGIPLLVRTVTVTVDHEGFIFNPTNCEPLTVDGTITSAQGTNVAVSNHFQVANCAKLSFKPTFTVSTQARTSRKNGASLDVKVSYPKGAQANIRRVAVQLPRQLPSRLTTIQKACPSATFAANPASCPTASNVGTATALTPILNVPLTGPAYLVSHGGAAFPDIVVILQGQGVTIYLTGAINISKKSITSSTFNTVPDAPITRFELKLPEGPHSALTATLPPKTHGNLCHTKLTMPTSITGQNGTQIKQNTHITITGCPKTKTHKKTKPKK